MGSGMSAFADARRRIVEALEPVLPGRVDPYGMAAMPCMYIGVAVPVLRQAGNATVKAARFAVSIEYDGADRAQIAGLDEVTAKACDAIDAAAGLRWTDAQPGIDQSTEDSPRTRQFLILTVEATISARSFCAPDVVEAVIPPPLIERSA